MAIAPECRQEIVGIRPGEKIHEEMITSSDSFNTVDIGRYYAILPVGGQFSMEEYCAALGATPVPSGFAYDSGSNPEFLSVDELRRLIDVYVSNPEVD
jgi:UDP-N-acetylglucosamine 4,6-dehydratase/5-epimerase